MAVKTHFCPFSESGCESGDQVCRFWDPKKGCDIRNAIKALKSLPNHLKRIEERLEQGKR